MSASATGRAVTPLPAALSTPPTASPLPPPLPPTQIAVVKRALADGEEPDTTDSYGLTPLMWAARVGRISTAKYLISRGAVLSLEHAGTGFTALHFAAYHCRCEGTRSSRRER